MTFAILFPCWERRSFFIILYALIIAPLFLAVKIFFYKKTANFIAK